jgi:hypothetical protein
MKKQKNVGKEMSPAQESRLKRYSSRIGKAIVNGAKWSWQNKKKILKAVAIGVIIAGVAIANAPALPFAGAAAIAVAVGAASVAAVGVYFAGKSFDKAQNKIKQAAKPVQQQTQQQTKERTLQPNQQQMRAYDPWIKPVQQTQVNTQTVSESNRSQQQTRAGIPAINNQAQPSKPRPIRVTMVKQSAGNTKPNSRTSPNPEPMIKALEGQTKPATSTSPTPSVRTRNTSLGC